MRQLSGMAGIRFSLGIHPDHWELMALRRTNIPKQAIPDAIIHLKPRILEAGKQKRSWRNVGLTYFDDIAVEWDSGSATRSDLETKVVAYNQLACCQLWVAPTMARAKTLQDVCCSILEPFHVGILVVDWRTGQCTGASLPKRGTQLSEILEPTMREVHQPWKWK